MNWDKIKNWVFGGGGAVVFILLMGFIDWRVSVKVSAALTAQDLGTDTKIVSMDTSIADNKRTGEENAEDIEQNRRNVESAFAALMGRSVPSGNDD